MKKISLFALSFLFLTSCKYSGTWGVNQELTFKTKSGVVSVPVGAHWGHVSASKSKFNLTFKMNRSVSVEIKIPKEKFQGTQESFEVKGADIGQAYDFSGTSYSETTDYESLCQTGCEEDAGEECTPQYYTCTQTTTTGYLSLELLDPATREVKATFEGSHTIR